MVYRQVTQVGSRAYDALLESGLYDQLVSDGLLLAHVEEDPRLAAEPGAYRVLRPEQLGFVSHPWEWSFSQLRDAALLTLELERRALARGLTLKDASAHNVQYDAGRSVHIDSLSFEPYSEGRPWSAYRQFCQHFLGPLALMSRVDLRLGRLLEQYLDGIPLDLTTPLLPFRTRLTPSLGIHLHAHSWTSRRHQDDPPDRAAAATRQQMTLQARRNLVDSLRDAVQGCTLPRVRTTWSDYYAQTNYSDEAMASKTSAVAAFLEQTRPTRVWDLGANVGRFSRMAAERGALTVAWDADAVAVDTAYRMTRDEPVARLLPLLVDLTNPSPDLGWISRERAGFFSRADVDLVLALGLVHHLAIGANVPLASLADLLARLAPWAVVEWVPKEDSQVARLLATRQDIFPTYTLEGFRAAFETHFRLVASTPISGSNRRIDLFQRLD
jgi:SAM-dependent methyltransferase